MLKRLHNQFGTAGLVLSIVAIVLALGGGAYAANHATASKAKAGPRGKTGKTGPAGPAGPAGPQGPAGPAGANGSAGANGKSVTATAIAAGEPGCSELGGAEVKQEGAGSGTEVCNGEKGHNGTPGKQGEPWTPNSELPAKATETGTWSFGTIKGEAVTAGNAALWTSISFPIQLKNPLSGSGCAEEMTPCQVHYINASQKEVLEGGAKEVEPKECLGSAEEPSAKPGNLCIYAGPFVVGATLTTESIGNPATTQAGTGKAGAVLAVLVEGKTAPSVFGFGTWAVTGEE